MSLTEIFSSWTLPYKVKQDSIETIIAERRKQELLDSDKYVHAPINVMLLPNWIKNPYSVTPSEHAKRSFMQANPTFWKGKKILEIGCAHDIVPKIMSDMHSDDFDYVGIDVDEICPKYHDETKDRKNIKFYPQKDVKTLEQDDFQQDFDLLLYLGLSPLNLKTTRSYLKEGGFMIYESSEFCWNHENNKSIENAGFKLKEQIWQDAKYFLSKNELIVSPLAYFIYQKKSKEKKQKVPAPGLSKKSKNLI